MRENNSIKLLPDSVINKIAAGEVVERPASVLKELLENSLDAGASAIRVETVAGGSKLVAVHDDGRGMTRNNAMLAIERHATSKIVNEQDIDRIDTLGFRGEALAAIASVSRFRMISCAENELAGTELLVVGGKIQDVRDIGAPRGTSIEVRDLFFNVPARQKFLRSHPVELSHLRSVFMNQAIANPTVGMSLKIDGNTTLSLAPGAGLHDRLTDLFKADYLTRFRRIDFTGHDVKVTGYAGLPATARSDRGEQYIFVNGRATTAPAINFAIREGYHTLLPRDQQPCIFLFVEINPTDVDVNVHPTKREIRLHKPNLVRDAVIEAVRRALGATNTGPKPMMPPLSQSMPTTTTPRSAPEPRLTIDNMPQAPAFQYPGMPVIPLPASRPSGAPHAEQATETHLPGMAPATPAQPQAPSDRPWEWCRVIGQVGGLYVLLETEDGYAVMDPHAAHERVLFERYSNDLIKHTVATQPLLVPENVALPPSDATRVRHQLEALREMGFGISEFGGDSFLMDAMPAYFKGAAAGPLLAAIAAGLEEAGRRSGSARWNEEAIAQAACKAAVKARDRLSREEIEKLVVDLARTEMPYTCPHGRPTLIFTPFRDLNRKFGRE